MIFGINTTLDISKLPQISLEITYNNFEISLVVFMPNITTNLAITYTNLIPLLGHENIAFQQYMKVNGYRISWKKYFLKKTLNFYRILSVWRISLKKYFPFFLVRAFVYSLISSLV